MHILRLSFPVLLAILLAVPAGAQTVTLHTEEMMVSSDTPGIELYVRNKRPETMTAFTPDRIVLFVHGATYPADTSFDLELNGLSWMDYISERGYDVYLMDVRGYGFSTRPPEMSQPAEANGPIVHTDVAARDIGAVVDFILARRKVEKLTLIGWSWGTMTTGFYTSQHNNNIARLVLYAPVWLRQIPSLVQSGSPLGAYRTVDRKSALQRWLTGVPANEQATLIPAGWFDAWWGACMISDPVGAAMNPPVVRAPNGVTDDGAKYWGADTRYYDPADIRVPVLLAVGEWDSDTPPYMAQSLFARLANAPSKRLVMLGGGTHTIIMEKNRMDLFREVQLFLDEGR